MSTLVIGDIHGCLRALETLVDFVGLSKEDQIIALGDYIDRGPDSKGVIEYLQDLKSSHRLTALKGNHEQMMEDSRYIEAEYERWIRNGGNATLKSYGALHLDEIPQSCWGFLDACSLLHEGENHIFVHAIVE